MSELVWDIKNGELDSVKNEIENKVNFTVLLSMFDNMVFVHSA